MKTIFNLTGAALAVCLAGELAAAQPPRVWVEREGFFMGTVLRVQVAAGERESGFEAVEAAFGEVRRLEKVLSSWTPASEIGRVNAGAVGEEVAVSSELMALLVEAAGWSASTGGAFSPAVGALVDAWDLRGEGRRPSAGDLDSALRASAMASFHLDAERASVRRTTTGAWLDTGGFGKGAALRAAERVLRERGIGAAMLDFGGQVLAYGDPPDAGEGWAVGVAHPASREGAAATLRIRSGSASTSAQSERYIEVDGERFGHVLDPRSGQPARAWGSVTVVAADPVVADVLSTALFVMGPRAGREWAAGRQEGVLFLELRGGEVEASWNEAFEQYQIRNHFTSER